MTGPEVMRAFHEWWPETRWERAEDATYPLAYPLYIGGPHAGRWYVRERHPGVRVWRAEEDGGFALVDPADYADHVGDRTRAKALA